jgi:hypothetical protein
VSIIHCVIVGESLKRVIRRENLHGCCLDRTGRSRVQSDALFSGMPCWVKTTRVDQFNQILFRGT